MKLDKNKFTINALENIRKRNESIAVVGLGYVGLPLALTFTENNFSVIGIDVDQQKIRKLKNKESYLKHINNSRISRTIEAKKLIPTSDFSKAEKCMAIILCVPTPLNKNREPDLRYVKDTLNSLKNFLRKGQLLSLESTTYPGTTEEVLKPFIESLGFEIGKDFFLIYSPEREDPGNKKYSTSSIPKIIGGITPICREIGIELYSKIIKKLVPVSSTRAAEITKLLENIHRAVNIGLMNELKILSDKMDIDLYEIIDAAATKPFGFTPYYPGPGLGGHCIPIDPFYLTWKAREYGMNTKFIELAGEINASMPQYVIEKIFNLLNARSKSIKDSKILVLGLSYKKNIDDIRESPSLEIIYNLIKRGAIVKYNDPYVPKLPKVRKYDLDVENINLTEKTLRTFDCVLLLTDHDEFPYELIKNHSKLIIDTRGRFNLTDNIFRA